MTYEVECIDIRDSDYKRLDVLSYMTNMNRRECYALGYGRANRNSAFSKRCSLVIESLETFSNSKLESFSVSHVTPKTQEVNKLIYRATDSRKDFLLEVHTHPLWSDASLSDDDITRYRNLERDMHTCGIPLLLTNAILCGSDFRFYMWQNGRPYSVPYRRISDIRSGGKLTGFEDRSSDRLMNRLMNKVNKPR